MGRISTGLALNIPRCSHCALAQSDVEGGRLRRCTDCVYRFCSRKECGRAAVEHRSSGLCSKLKQIADDERFIRFVFPHPFPCFFLCSFSSDFAPLRLFLTLLHTSSRFPQRLRSQQPFRSRRRVPSSSTHPRRNPSPSRLELLLRLPPLPSSRRTSTATNHGHALPLYSSHHRRLPSPTRTPPQVLEPKRPLAPARSSRRR